MERILYTSSKVPESVVKSCDLLEELFTSKLQKLYGLFSNDEKVLLLQTSLELALEGIIPDWSIKLSALGSEVPTVSTRIELLPVKEGVTAEVLKQSAQKALALLTEIKKSSSEAGPK